MKNYLILFLLFPVFACAQYDSYCDVSRRSPTYGMDFDRASELVWKLKPKASVECGIIENIISLRTGHAGEGHYKNVVLLADQDDEKFIAVGRSENLTIFTYTSARREVFYAAVLGNYPDGRLLEAGAYSVGEFKDVIMPNGYKRRLFILEKIL